MKLSLIAVSAFVALCAVDLCAKPPRAELVSFVRHHSEIEGNGDEELVLFWEVSRESDELRFLRGNLRENREPPAVRRGFSGFAFAPDLYVELSDYEGYAVDARRPDDCSAFRMKLAAHWMQTPTFHYELRDGFGFVRHQASHLFGISISPKIIEQYSAESGTPARSLTLVLRLNFSVVRDDRRGYVDGGEFELRVDEFGFDDEGHCFVRMPQWDASERSFDDILKVQDEKAEPGATDNPGDAQRLREDH